MSTRSSRLPGCRSGGASEIVKGGRTCAIDPATHKLLEINYEDRAPQKGLNFYYVRAVQKNRMAAWSSPIWVNVK